jgi:HEAT repeat protein
MPKFLLIFLALQFTLALPGTAQDGPTYAGCGKDTRRFYSCNGECGMPSSSPADLHLGAGDLLQNKYPLKLSQEELRSSLRSDDAQLRYLAAWVLADQGQKDAVPDIFTAFETESQPRPKAYLACALAELGDPRGVAALHQFCESDRLPEDLRLDVVRFLVEIHETPCIAPVVEALKGSDPGNWQVMPIIPNIKGLSPEESAQLRALLLESLSQPGSAVRLVAAQTLSQMHDFSALPELQTALANERDAIVRSALRDALDALQVQRH